MSLVRYKLDELAWSEILQKMNKNASYAVSRASLEVKVYDGWGGASLHFYEV